MAQHGTYYQDNYGAQHGPLPSTHYAVPSYSEARRSSMPDSMYYSNINGYGHSGTSQNTHAVPISSRSRSSVSQSHHSSYATGYHRPHSQPSQVHSSVQWNNQGSYGYTNSTSPSYSSSQYPSLNGHPSQMVHSSYPHSSDRHDQHGHYMNMGTVERALPRTTFAAAGTETPLYDMFGMSTDSPHQISSTGMPLSGYTFSPIPSPSSSPSPTAAAVAAATASRRASIDSTNGIKKCSHCLVTSTPLWRRNPENMQPLCNACGLYLQQRGTPRPPELIAASTEEEDSTDESERDPSAPECSHCQTHVTSVWRRSKTGEQLCNACGVYLRLRGKPRPLSLKTKKIKPRPHSSKHSTK